MYVENRLSVVMRTLGNRPNEISRAIRSVAKNEYPNVEIVVVYQGTDDTIRDDLKSLKSLLPAGMILNVIQNQLQGDQRARNLNLGMAAASGRWLAFLDDDDFIAVSHYRLLIDLLNETGFAWGYSQTVVRREKADHQVIEESIAFNNPIFSVQVLFSQNHIPIHSFIMDRSRLHASFLAEGFCEALNRSEDWDFLIRLAFFHEPCVLPEATCTYCIREGAENTNLSLMGSQEMSEKRIANELAWRDSKLLVIDRMRSLVSTVWWGREFFTEVFKQSQEDIKQKGRLLRLRDKIVRYAIRQLERLL